MKINHVTSSDEGNVVIQQIFDKQITNETILFLSGGRTPIPLYSQLSLNNSFHPKEVYMVDERYGEKFHEESNETMIRDAGLLSFLEEKHIPFHPMLQYSSSSLEETAKQYNQEVEEAFKKDGKKIALLGIGPDGHIAGIAPNRGDFLNPLFSLPKERLVASFIDFDGPFGQRVTLTFSALSQMDELIILVLGENKKNALQLMKEQGREEELPARFLMRPEMSDKVTLVTDQDF